MAGNEIGDLADVHLEEATPHDEAKHAREDTGGRRHRNSACANMTANCLHQTTTLRAAATSVPAGTS
jgi:hypothetical protein